MNTCERAALRALVAGVIIMALGGQAVPAGAADTDIELQAKHARQGAGLRFGTWQVRNLVDPAGGSASTSPAFEGYFEKGLDRHLSWESTVGFWRRTQSATEQGTFGATQRELNSYLVPTFTALKVHPFTGPSAVIEPYLSAGVGFVLGIDRESASSTDPLGPNGESTRFGTGFGLKTGAGLAWRPGNAFGLSVGGGYQWASFGEDVGGERTYEGFGANMGVTYRFQY
jgi:hypothetical protein